ncbi:MAG: Phage integrase [Proteobacteria bacterium]|nr:Phage integrase [Pseudomonadota bacterium]
MKDLEDMSKIRLEWRGKLWRYKVRVPTELLAHYYPEKYHVFTTAEPDQESARVLAWHWLAQLKQDHAERRGRLSTSAVRAIVEASLTAQKKQADAFRKANPEAFPDPEEGSAFLERMPLTDVEHERHAMAARADTLRSLSDEQREAIKASARRMLMAGDDTVRRDREWSLAFLAVSEARQAGVTGEALAVPLPPDSHGPLTDAEGDWLEARNRATADRLGRAAGRNQCDVIKPYAVRAALEVGLRVDWASPAGVSLLAELLSIFAETSEIVARRDRGPYTETPAAPVLGAKDAKRGVMLSDVLKDFMGRQAVGTSMFKKYSTVLPMFLEQIGDRPIQDIKQRMIDGYFDLLLCLPPHWADVRKKKGLTVPQIAAQEWPKCLAPKTFKSSYIAAVRPLLKFAKRTYGDEGWPGHLTVEGIEYRGDREEDERKQRAIRPDELRRLFNGVECAAFAADPALHDQYWFPLIGLYTGARVNEVCQLNPQCDIRQDAETGIWFFDITDESETAEGVNKSVKNERSRRPVPIHSKLLDLGVLQYVERVKAQGAALLFPEFPPSKGKASAAAEKWFRRHLVALGLRDETPKACLLGFHAFRHTFITQSEYAQESRYGLITGHAGIEQATQSPVGEGYPISFFFVLDEPKSWRLPFRRLDTLLSAQIDDSVEAPVDLTSLPAQRWPEAPGDAGAVFYGHGTTAAIPYASGT